MKRIPKVSLPSAITSLSKKQQLQLGFLSVLTLSLFFIVSAVKVTQIFNSRADTNRARVSCEKVAVDLAGTIPDPSRATSLVSQAQAADRDLDLAVKDYMRFENQQSRSVTTPNALFASMKDFPIEKAYAACKKNNDCSGDKICKGGQCVKRDNPPQPPPNNPPVNSGGGGKKCKKNNDCPDGKVCRDGSCEKKNDGGGGNGGKHCKKNNDCPGNKVCRQGKCENKNDTNGGNNDAERRQQILDRIRNAAHRRKALLIELMYHNPSQMLNLSKGDRNREGYYLLEDNCKAVTKTLQGEIVVTHYDKLDKTSYEEYALVLPDGEEIMLHPSNQQVAEQILPETIVEVSGFNLDDEVAFESNQQISMQRTVESQMITAENTQATRTTGKQRTIAIFGEFKDEHAPGRVDSNRDELIRLFKQYYSETSYGKIDFEIDKTAWITVPEELRASCGMNRKFIRALKHEADQRVNFQRYDRVIYFAPFGANRCGYSGVANLGKRKYNTDDGHVRVSTAWVAVDDSNFNNKTTQEGIRYIAATAVHEMGHGLDLMHANAQWCDYYEKSNQIDPKTCKFDEYGDIYNVMGDGLGHFSAPHLEKLRWLTGEQIKTVTEGTYTLDPLEGISSGIKALKIPRTDGDFTYVEYRQPIGLDTAILEDTTNTYIFKGATLHTHSKKYKDKATWLLDAQAGTPYQLYYASVIPGMSIFTDESQTRVLEVTSATPAGLTVRVYSWPPTSPTPFPTKITPPTPTNILRPSPTFVASPSDTITPTRVPPGL